RQERLRNMENEEMSSTATDLNSTNSVTETGFSMLISTPATNDDDQALLERLAKREERRQRRMKEAMERQKEFDPTITDGDAAISEDRPSRRSPLRDTDEESGISSWREKEGKKEEAKVQVQVTVGVTEEAVQKKEDEEEEEKPQTSYLTEQVIVSVLKPLKLSSHFDRMNEHKVQKQDPMVKQEAERKLVELKRLRNQAESEEFEKMKQKQQSAEVELEELKKKREERKKILEEEEKQKKQQLEEKKTKEERQKMREEIERRRAEAAEKKRQKEESSEESKAPFKCMSPKGASTKLNKLQSNFFRTSKAPHTPIVCKIGNRLEQYTSATKDVKSPKSPVKDLPAVEGVRNIKSMWEKGNVQSSASPGPATPDTAGINIGAAGRINSWKAKTPETKTAETKIPEAKPAETKPFGGYSCQSVNTVTPPGANGECLNPHRKDHQ
uniref:Caldesmon 1b n=1 Tax=Electrophorus electricus TaxID=8005 RepID=A0AAY5E7E8_ELEEL